MGRDSGSSRAKAAVEQRQQLREATEKEACISRKRMHNISNKGVAAAAEEQQEKEAKM